MRKKVALITGLNSQDGSYLAEFLLEKDYKVLGTVRSKNPSWPYGFDPHSVDKIYQLDLGYPSEFSLILNEVGLLDEVYNLAAQSHVGNSFGSPEETYNVTGLGASMLMELYFRDFPNGKFYQASSSEMFGNGFMLGSGYDENDEFLPASPYAVAKVMAHYAAKMHRDRGRYASCGIMFNHESERRHISFVTQKICNYVATLHAGGTDNKLRLGNISAVRDWGYAPEYVEIMWNILQQDTPSDYVVGTGKSFSVEAFLIAAFEKIGLDYKDYTMYDVKDYKRPNDVQNLRANPATMERLLGRSPLDMYDLVDIMVDHQIKIQGDEK